MKIDAADYTKLAAKLKTADKAVARAIRQRLRAAAKPLGEHVRDKGSERMPARGGLRDRMLAAPVTTAFRGTGADVWVGNRRKSQFMPIDRRGVLRHPVWGRKWWVAQDVPAGTFTEAVEQLPADVRAEFAKVFADIYKELGL